MKQMENKTLKPDFTGQCAKRIQMNREYKININLSRGILDFINYIYVREYENNALVCGVH